MTEAAPQSMLQTHLKRTLSFLASYLDSSEVICLAILDTAGRITFINQALSEVLKMDGAEATGHHFIDFLTGPDGETFTKQLSIGETPPDKALLLNLVDAGHFPHSLHFRLAAVKDGFLLLGEPLMDKNQALQEELLELNNQLSVLSRENIRKGRELAKTLAELQKTQAMLVHKEKMASLGQMTAGIAHEINNPLAFVLSNEQTLKRDCDDLLSFVNTLGDALPEIGAFSPKLHLQISTKAAEVELEYLAEAMPRKIAANIEGLERVKQIILDLRNFSRLDEAERKPSNLAQGIVSTLRFLSPLTQAHGVTVETEFASLPDLLCSPGPLNQAINNVLTNAIQASRPNQTVRVSTRLHDDWYCVEVIDQGDGITPESLPKIFDPFFTTKPVGAGTGLGLSIAHQIVTAHEGRIEIDSSPGVGTTLRILLPNKQQNDVVDSAKDKVHDT